MTTEPTPSPENAPEKAPRESFFTRLLARAMRAWDYLMGGVWLDPRNSWKVRTIKTLNLCMRSFMDTDLQVRAASLTYNTVLAVVPVLAMIFAIGRGFGFQNLLQNQLYDVFPSQHRMVETTLRFVDGYLAQASEGVFVGIGLVFLLWTMISLLSNVEDAFNKIWDVKQGRTIWRKITDYLTIFLILPILMVCAGGLSILMSTALHTLLPVKLFTPAIDLLLDFASLALTWLFFTVAYMLIPNAKVNFTNALIAGTLAGLSFQVLQWLFLSGQLYVSKYNAIYGSFSFLPLFLLWVDLTWLITLTGGVLCYALQNIVALSFIGQIDKISPDYRRRVCLVVMTIVCRRFQSRMAPLTVSSIARDYCLPARLVKDIASTLTQVGLLSWVVTTHGDDPDQEALQPALPAESLTVGELLRRINVHGQSGFIPDFETRFAPVDRVVDSINKCMDREGDTVRFIDIPLDVKPLPRSKTA